MLIGRFTALAIVTLVFTSCEFKCEVGNLKKKEATTSTGDNITPTSPKTLNDIELTAKNVSVDKAFLARESGDLLPSDNSVSLGEKISLVININNGWKESDGKSFIGATEKITTDNGTEILSSGDMFAAYNESGVDAGDAKVVTLRARITSQPPEPVEYYLVNFRVWDKKGNGEITGRYKFHIK